MSGILSSPPKEVLMAVKQGFKFRGDTVDQTIVRQEARDAEA